MNYDDLIMTTRIRLARNVAKVPFAVTDPKFFKQLADSITHHFPDLKAFPLRNLSERDSLFEQHLISADFLQNLNYGILVTNRDNKINIMLGEEDHVRIQVITNKFALTETYQRAKAIADNLETDFEIAKDDQLGYLTRCPTNLGGGIRASVMIYLPALTITKQITKVFNELDNHKITIRGVYGENSASSGCIYQISNQDCIAMSDLQVLNMLTQIINKFITIELNLQRQLWQKSPDQMIDQVMRAWGLLTNAHLLSTQEAITNLMWLKLGINLKIIAFRNNRVIDDLFFIIQPATLATNNRLKSNDSIYRDRLRAAQVREKLLLFRIK